MTKSYINKILKAYVKSHKELQKDLILYIDILKAAEETGIHQFYILMYTKYGRVY